LAVATYAQQIPSTYADLTLAGNWQSARQYAAGNIAEDIFYDAGSGALLLISQQPGLKKVGEISKYFAGNAGPNPQAAGLLADSEFPLPFAFTERAARDLAKGSKPPKMWDLKDGEGNPVWFYASQLFEDYKMRGGTASSEITELYSPVRVTKAEQRAVQGGDLLLFEVETERPASDAALKKFHMPASYKDQRLRYGWIQFAPGGITSGQGVLAVGFAAGVNSGLTIDDVAKQVSSAKVKTL